MVLCYVVCVRVLDISKCDTFCYLRDLPNIGQAATVLQQQKRQFDITQMFAVYKNGWFCLSVSQMMKRLF